MPDPIKLHASDEALLEQVFHFAARRAPEGVYIGQHYSRSLSTPVCIVVALGDQALAVHSILMKVAVPDDEALEARFNAESNGSNGNKF